MSDARNEIDQNLAEAARNAGTALRGFGSALNGTNSRLDTFGQGLNQAGSAVFSLGQSFGAIGTIAGGVVKAFTALASIVSTQNQRALDLNNAFTAFGGQIRTGGQSLGEFYDSMQKGNESFRRYQSDFTSEIGNLSEDLQLFGGNIDRGGKEFVKLAQFRSDQERRAFGALGIGTKDFIKSTGDFIRLQSAFGNSAIFKDEAKLTQRSRDYATTLTELTAITGAQRDEIKRTQEALATDAAFQAKIREMRQAGDEAGAQKMIDFVTAATVRGGKDVGNAVKEVALYGNVISEQGNKTTLIYGDLVNATTDVINGSEKTGRALKRIGESAEKSGGYLDQMGQAVKYGAGEQLNIYGRTYQEAARLAATSEDDLNKLVKGQMERGDDITDQQANQEKMLDTLSQAFGELATMISKYVNPALVKLSEVLLKTIKWIGAKLEGVGDWVDKSLKSVTEYARSKGMYPQQRGQQGADSGGGGGAQDATGRKKPRAGMIQRSEQEQLTVSRNQTDDYSSEIKGLINAKRDVTGGGKISETLMSSLKNLINVMAEKGFPIGEITGLNDKFHQREFPGSAHTKGRAVDFVLAKSPTRENTREIMEIIKQAGFNRVYDEYFNPTGATTGPHYHAELAKGGITRGPSLAGEAGPEAVVPLPDGKTIPVRITNMDAFEAQAMPMSEVMSKLTEKLDTMIDYLKSSAQLQEDLVLISRNS